MEATPKKATRLVHVGMAIARVQERFPAWPLRRAAVCPRIEQRVGIMWSCKVLLGILLPLVALSLAGRPTPTELTTGTILKVDLEADQLHVLRPDGRVFVFERLPRTLVTIDRQLSLFELLEARWRVVVYTHGRPGIATRIDAFTDAPSSFRRQVHVGVLLP